MEFRYYRKGQGSSIRMVALIGVTILVLFGCFSLYKYVPIVDTSTNPYSDSFWGKPLTTIPFFDFTVRTGMILSVFLCGIIMALIYIGILNRPKTADFLIDTEIELKKVSWPPRRQHMGSSVAVIVSVIILGVFLLFVDSILKQIMRLIRLQ